MTGLAALTALWVSYVRSQRPFDAPSRAVDEVMLELHKRHHGGLVTVDATATQPPRARRP